jgi:hypothetical protein
MNKLINSIVFRKNLVIVLLVFFVNQSGIPLFSLGMLMFIVLYYLGTSIREEAIKEEHKRKLRIGR